tara:strand:+ start:72 stop:1457 length:1386 start_codon:yes stop_codon:yes gene_type:complete
MALQIDPRMYSGGAVELDSQPVVNMYANLMAKKDAQERAKNESIDEYIRGLTSKITPTGTRTADIPEFNDRLNTWREFVTQNKSNMGNIAIQMKANELYQQALGVPVWSKGITEREKDVVDILKDPNKSGKLRKDPTTGKPVLFGQMHKNKQSRNIKDPNTGEWVANPDYGEFDLTADIYKKENIDEGKLQEEVSKGMTADAKPDLAHPINDKGYTFYNTTAKFSHNQVSEQAKKTKNKIYNEEELMDFYEKEFNNISQNKSAIDELNTYYKKYIDPDGEITDPAQYGAAKMAKTQEAHELKTGTVSKRDLDKAFQQSLIKIFNNKGSGLGDGGVDDYNIIKYYTPKAEIKKITKDGKSWLGGKITEKELVMPYDKIDEGLRKFIGIEPKEDEDGHKYYSVDKEGNWAGVNNSPIDPKVVEQKYYNSLNSIKDKKGLPEDKSILPKPKTETIAEKMRRLKG